MAGCEIPDEGKTETAVDPKRSPERRSSVPKTVLVIGGGISGLTVAHELSRSRKFNVEVCEQNSALGGRARSGRSPEARPTEHAMRVFLASYTCLFRIMDEVQDANKKALLERLVYPSFSFRYGRNEFRARAEFGGYCRYIADAFRLSAFFLRCGVTISELSLFLTRTFRLLWLSEDQVKGRIARISFEEYMDAPARSPAFRATLMRVSEMLVAAKATASAALVSRVVLEWFVGPMMESSFNRKGFASLNGPTSERMIDPWSEHLAQDGVRFTMDTRIVSLLAKYGQISGALTDSGRILRADYYCLCLPLGGLNALITPEMRQLLPSLPNLSQLGNEWSAGIQYYLREIPPRLIGTDGLIVVDVKTSWSIVYMLQSNLAPWSGVTLPADTVAVLSVVMSNALKVGQHIAKPFMRCHPEEMKTEALAQIGLLEELKDAPYAIGPDLHFISCETYDRNPQRYRGSGISKIDDTTILVSDGRLYVRKPRDIDEEPENRTDIDNLFIAGEFTRTNYAIPTMEKSCESGMRCALAICEATGCEYDRERITPAELPFGFLRAIWFPIVVRTAAFGLFLAVVYAVIR